MAAAHVGEEVLNEYYGEAAPVGGNAGPPVQAGTLDRFRISDTNLNDWLNVWRMTVDPENPNRQSIINFTENLMPDKAFDVVKSEIDKLGSIKFGMEIHFKRERQNENGEMLDEKQTLLIRRTICL